MKKLKNIVPQLCYVAATVCFVVSIITAICGTPVHGTLGVGGLFLILGAFFSERAKKNKDK